MESESILLFMAESESELIILFLVELESIWLFLVELESIWLFLVELELESIISNTRSRSLFYTSDSAALLAALVVRKLRRF